MGTEEDWMLDLKVRVQIFQEENCLLAGPLFKYGPSTILARTSAENRWVGSDMGRLKMS